MKVTKTVSFDAEAVKAALVAAHPHLASKDTRIAFHGLRAYEKPLVWISWDEEEVEDWGGKAPALAPATKKGWWR